MGMKVKNVQCTMYMYMYMYIMCACMYVHVVPVLGNPQVDLADLRIESAIRTFCGFEDCGFPYKSRKMDADLRIESSIRIFCGFADCGFPNADMHMYVCA